MRLTFLLPVLLTLAACGFSSEPQPVDAASLPPLTGREQAILVGAESALRQGNIAAAEKDYLSAIGASTGRVEAHIALAKLYASQNQSEKERAILDRGLKYQPNNPGLNYLLGKLELAAGNNDAALAAFERGLSTVPGDMDLSIGTAIAHDMLGQHRIAQSIYQRVIAQHKNENLAGAKTNLGMSYLFTNEPKKTISTLQAEAKKPNSSLVTRYNLALAYSLLNKPLDAKFALRGEDDEATRLATLARLKQYIADTNPTKQPTEVKPVLAQPKAPKE